MRRIIIYVLLIIICLFLGYAGYVNRPLDLPSDDLLNVTYFRYNNDNGNYDSIKISKTKIITEGDALFNGCSSYTFNSQTNIVKMSCGKAFRIITYSKDYLVLEFEEERYYFFVDQESSYEMEFKNTFDMTHEDLAYEVNEKLESIKIDSNRLLELINGNDTSFIYVKNNVCEDECIVFAYAVDKSTSFDNLYYIEEKDLTESIIFEIQNLNSNFINSTANRLLVVSNGKVNNILFIQVKGFNTEFLNGYLDNYLNNEGGINENNA